MRQNFRFPFALLTVFSFLALPGMLGAQQAKKPASPTTNQPSGKSAVGRPAAAKELEYGPPVRQAGEKEQQNAPKPDPISPELDKILLRWETESDKIKSLHGKHMRQEFNKTFAVEKVSEGEFFLETPDKGRIDMVGKDPKGSVSKRKDEAGEPYALEKGSSERWICTGEEIIAFDDVDKTYSRDVLPQNMRGKNIVHSPLPFLFGMKAEEAKNRFSMTLLSIDKEKERVTLKAVPRMDSDRQNYHEAYIILDTKRFIPVGVRLIDPNGLETIYMFKDVTINDGGFATRLVARFSRDPYKPSFIGYKRFVPNDAEPPAAGKPNGKANDIKQTSGAVPASGAPKREADAKPNEKPRLPRTTAVPSSGNK